MVSGCAVFSSRNLTYDIVILTMFHVIVSAVSGHRDVTTRYHLKFLNYLVSSHCLCLNMLAILFS
jgi:hypothetical protein